MTYFTQNDIDIVAKQRKKAITIMIIFIAIYVLFTVACIIWYRTLPYESPTITTVKLVDYPVSVLFVIFMFIYGLLYLRRINKRYKYQKNMTNGIRETSVGTFLEYSEELQEKDGVDFKALIFIEWNKYKKDFFERKVLVFYDRPFPVLIENAKVEYTTQSNVLIEYRVLGDENDKSEGENEQS